MLPSSRHDQSPNATFPAKNGARSTSAMPMPPTPSPHQTDLFQQKRRGFIATGAQIVKRETPLGLYKGLGAVCTGIIPKMAIRFTSYEWYLSLIHI